MNRRVMYSTFNPANVEHMVSY